MLVRPKMLDEIQRREGAWVQAHASDVIFPLEKAYAPEPKLNRKRKSLFLSKFQAHAPEAALSKKENRFFCLKFLIAILLPCSERGASKIMRL